jgi:hypothetical protein
MAPKMEGTWNLHTATLHDKLDFFVLFSSIAAVHPQPGMGSYAAANAFLDAFAHYRRALGMPAISVNWGGWNEIGLAKAAGADRSIQGYVLQGMRYFSGYEALRALGQILGSNPIQAVAVPFDWNKFTESNSDHAPPLFAEFMSRASGNSGAKTNRSEILDQLTEAESGERKEILESYIQETLGRVLKLAKRKIDRERPMGTMGLDSLMGLDFVRRLSSTLQIAVPATVTFNYPTIRLLSQHLMHRMQLQPTDIPSVKEATSVSEKGTSARLPDDVSEEDALQALMGEKGRSS